MIAATLGTIAPITDIEDAQQAMSRNGAESLAVARALAEEGTFANAELINSQESDDFRHTSLSLNPGVLAGFLTVNANAGEAWSVSSQEELLDRGFPLFAKIKERAERLEHRGNMFLYRGDVRTLTIKIDRLERAYRRTLEAHPDWPIAQAVRGLNEIDHRALTILIGKDLNFADADDELFLGEGLARAVAGDVLVAVYRHFGIPLSSKAGERFRRCLARRPRGGYGRNAYNLQDYGLDEQAEKRRYADYVAYFRLRGSDTYCSA